MNKAIHSLALAAVIVGSCCLALAQTGLEWNNVKSSDLREYASRLRGLGVPESVTRDILLGELERRLTENLGVAGADEYWRPAFGGQSQAAAALDAYRNNGFQRQKVAGIGEVLGAAAADALDAQYRDAVEGARFAFLPAGKRVTVAQTKAAYEQRISQAIVGIPPDPSELAQLAALRAELDFKLEALLTAEEKREYDLRFSQLAAKLRLDLSAFRPTEQEFRAIFAAKQDYERATSGAAFASLPAPAKLDLVKSEGDKLNQALSRALAPDRLKEYKRSESPDYQALLKFVEKQGLTAGVAGTIFDVQQEVQGLVKEVMDRLDIASDQKVKFLQGLFTEAEKAVSSELGPEVFKKYSDHPSGAWLRSFHR